MKWTYRATHAECKSRSPKLALIAGVSAVLTLLGGSSFAAVATLSPAATAAIGVSVTPAQHAQASVTGRQDSSAARHMAVVEAAVPRVLKQMTTRPAVTVKSGDTLSGISQRSYGAPKCWPGIYGTNKTIIGKNPDAIQPGQRLSIPYACSSTFPRGYHVVVYTKPLSTPAPVSTSSSANLSTNSGTGSGGGGGSGFSGGGHLSYGGLESLWESAGGPAWAAPQAASIAECESGGNQYAENPSGASGYWQILGQVVAGNIFDPMVNALNAVAKFRASGNTFAQWVCQ